MDIACCSCPRDFVALRALLATHYNLDIKRAFRLCYTFLNDLSFPGSSIFTKALRPL